MCIRDRLYPARGSAPEVSALESASFEAPAGSITGIIGRSGAGKSTLVNLLLRFYDLEGGRILVGGEDIAGVTQESLRGNIGMVSQDTALLHRSIRDNILFGNPDASEAQMIEAAKKAEAHDFILSLEDQRGRKGYDAMSASAESSSRAVSASASPSRCV